MMQENETVFGGDFQNWADVVKAFCIGHVEPEEILAAAYDQEEYEGRALVIYKYNGKYYIVEAAHCSCYGLEDEWYPEEYDNASLLLKVLKLSANYGEIGKVANKVIFNLESNLKKEEK